MILGFNAPIRKINSEDICEAGMIDLVRKDLQSPFLSKKLITSIKDIYELNYNKILQLEGFKERSVEKMKAAIEKSKTQPLWRLLVAFGIRHIGGTTAKLLSKQVTHLYDFKNWTEEKYLELNDIGPKVASSLVSFF